MVNKHYKDIIDGINEAANWAQNCGIHIVYNKHKKKTREQVILRIITVKTSSYFAVKAKSLIVVKIVPRKAWIGIEFKSKYDKYFTVCEMEHDEKTSKIKVTSFDEVIALATSIAYAMVDALSDMTGEGFGCYDRYVECSDAQKCTYPDKVFSFGCYYRKNLEQGRVFYGKNRNID